MTFDYLDLRSHGMIGFDTETCDPNILTMGPGYGRDGFIAGISVATEKGFKAYLPIAHEAGENLPKKKVLSWVKKTMALPNPKAGANLLYDMGYLEAEGIKVNGPLYDVMIAEPLLNENRFSYGLDVIGKARVDRGKDEDGLKEAIIARFGKQRKHEWKSLIWRMPGDVVAPYAIEDAALPIDIFKAQQPELVKQELWDLFILEMKLTPMLLAMRQRGIRVDLDYAEQLLAELEQRKQEELNEIWKMAKSEISVWAADELAILFDAQGVEYSRTPKTNKPSFTAQWLERCEHPIAERIVAARKMDKLCSVFLRGAILESHWKGRVHCNFNQLRGEGGGTVSGRFSCVAPWTPINTSKGIKRIDEVAVGDLVWTHENRWQHVSHTWMKGEEQMYDVHLSNGQVLTCTNKHRFLMQDGTWKTVGDIREHFKGVGKELQQHPTSSGKIQNERIEDCVSDCGGTEHVVSQRVFRPSRQHPNRGAEGVEGSSLIGRETEIKKPDVGKDGRATPELEGRMFESQGVCYGETQRKAYLRASSRHDEGAWSSKNSEGDACSSHRWEQAEQQLGQSCTGNISGPQKNSRATKPGQQSVEITKIEISGSYPVHDITVEEDESYSACGVFSHNSSTPNLQQISTRTEDGKKIRKMFLPDEGQDFYSYDYSQIEYRLMVHDAVTYKLPGAQAVADQYAKDPNTDFHKVVADMAGISRSAAKTVNFGIAYGEGIPKLVRTLGLTQEEGEAFMRKYHSNAPFMKPLSQGYSNMAAATGELRTLLGRKRRFAAWELTKWVNGTRVQTILPHRVPGARRAFTHAALNARIQGSAADLMKKAMVDIFESGVVDIIGVPQLTVHDELDGSKPKTKAGDEAYKEMGRIMQNVMKLNVPLLVDGGIGDNWFEAKSGGK